MDLLTDADEMPWGKYEGRKMADVPADYLHWYWTECEGPKKAKCRTCRVAMYIQENKAALEMEHEDGIW